VARRRVTFEIWSNTLCQFARSDGFKSRFTIFIKIFILTTACFEKLWGERSEGLNNILQVDVDRIRALLSKQVKIGEELEDLAKEL
jgi:hypothetical protein